MKKKILILALILGMMGTVSADKDTYDDGAFLDDWAAGTDQGEDNSMSVTSSFGFDDKYSAESSVSGSADGDIQNWARTLTDTAQDGESYSTWVYFNQETGVHYGLDEVVDDGRSYGSGLAEVLIRDGNFRVNGGGVSDIKICGTPTSGNWYKMTIEVNSNSIDAVLYDSNDDKICEATGIDASSSGYDFKEVYISTHDQTNNAATINFDLTSYDERTFNPPSFDSVSIDPSGWSLNSEINVSANVSDSDGTVSSVEADVWEDGVKIVDNQELTFDSNTGEYWYNGLFKTDEKDVYYNLTLTATDDDGATTTEWINRTLEDKDPQFTIEKPKNQTYGSQSREWKISTSENDDDPGESFDVDVDLDGSDLTTSTVTEGNNDSDTFTTSDGAHTIKVNVSEQDGDWTSKSVDFEVDSGFGDLNITDPTSNSTTKDLDNIDLKYTISNEPNLDSSSCEYSKDGGTKISISNCDNTTIQFGSVGDHNVKLWAKDTLGNYGSDSVSWFVDQENTIQLEDENTGSNIQEFEVTFDNGTKQTGGSTSNGNFTWLTSKAPKGSDVNVTVKADNYVTETHQINITDSYSNDITYKLERAGLELEAYDEQDNTPLPGPVKVEIQNTTEKKVVAWGESYVEGSVTTHVSEKYITGNPGDAFDEDLSTDFGADGGMDSGEDGETSIQGWVSLKDQNQTVNVKAHGGDPDDGDRNGRLKEVEMVKNGAWTTIWSGNKDGEFTLNIDIDNRQGEFNGKVRATFESDTANDRHDFGLYEVWANNREPPKFNSTEIPLGNVKIIADDQGEDNYRSREYNLKLDKFSTVSLRAYLLERGEGIFMTGETYNTAGDVVSGALVNVQRNIGGNYRTVSQKITGSDGSSSFYLDPDVSYKVVASDPSYSTFEGTFSPANYQYDPLKIQLGNEQRFNFSTRWDSVDYKLEPEDRFLNKSRTTDINWTVTDGQSDLTEYGLRLKHENGTLIKSDKVLTSPSGGTVNVSVNGSKWKQDKEFKVEAYFITSGKEYRIEKTYEFERSWTAGIFSLSKILDTTGDGLSNTSRGLFALLVTAVIGAGFGSRLGKDGAGFVVVSILGLFSIAKWFPLEIWTLTFLTLLGVYLYR